MFASNISANIFPFFGPFTEYKLHSLENEPESMNIIYSRIRDLVASSGNSALLSLTDKPSIASVKAAEAIQASKNDYLTRQFEQFLNNIINENFNLNYQWNITLWGDIFYWRDDAKITKEMIIQGGKGLLPRFLSSQDMTPEDYKGSMIYLDTLGIKLVRDTDAVEEKNPVGRPKLNDDEIINDNTGTSSDMGNNVSEIKMSQKFDEINLNLEESHICSRCGKTLDSHESFICDECLDQLFEERIGIVEEEEGS